MQRPRPRSAAPETSEVAEIVIDSVGGQGDGVSFGPVFTPFTLPGERVSVRRHGERAEIEALLEPSPDRTTPPCPHFGVCGGCALQHWSARPYLNWKVEQIGAALAREGLETDILTPFAAPLGSRRRISLHARHVQRTVQLGYKTRRSWSVVDVTSCSIAHPALVDSLDALRALSSAFFERSRSAPTLHLTWTETGLDVDVTGVEARSGGLSSAARTRAAELARRGDLARLTLSGETLYQARSPIVRFGAAWVELPPGGFLQAVEAAEVAMAEFALASITGVDRVADLFCGSGAFSFRLAEVASVLAFDSAETAIAALKPAIATAPGLKSIVAASRDLYRRPLLSGEMKTLEAVLFDPPRAGAQDQAREIAGSQVDRVVGVSCNPASFARDARLLVDGGFRLVRLLPVDQFLWSPHIELVGIFER